MDQSSVVALGLALQLISLLVFVLMVVCFCFIFSKAGYHWAMGLLLLLPFVNLIAIMMLAFGNWPVAAEVNRLKRSVNKLRKAIKDAGISLQELGISDSGIRDSGIRDSGIRDSGIRPRAPGSIEKRRKKK